MNTMHFCLIFLIAITILIVLPYQNVTAQPGMAPQDLYKQSDMVFYGQVITKESGPGPDYYYYQVKVETYFKNPQTSDSITVAGHKPSGGHVTYPQFEVGDRAIFYINKLDGINTLSPYSQQSGSACSLSSFGLDIPQNSGIIRGGFVRELRILDSAGNAISTIQVNHPLLVQYDDFVNGLPEARTVTATLTIQKYNDTTPVFYQKQEVPMIACSSTPKPHWNFTPVVSGHYIAILTSDNQTITTDFDVRNNLSTNVIDKARSLPPLQQFKSGIKTEDVKCNTDFLLAIKLDYSPACVKESSAIKLFLRGWIFGFANYQQVYFMEPNSTAQISVKYSPQNYQGQSVPDFTRTLYSKIYGIHSDSSLSLDKINATARPDFIHTNSNTIVNYAVTTGNAKGVYWLSLLDQCIVIPIAVGLDEQELTVSDLQDPNSAVSCPAPAVQSHVVNLSNVALKLVHQ
jgi:hypothetical protein